MVATSERTPTIEPAQLLHTWLFILSQLWQERSDRPITRSLKLREFVYDTYTVKFVPRQAQILTSEAAWGLYLIIEAQFKSARETWTRHWRAYDWQLKYGRRVIADIICEPMRHSEPTRRAYDGNFTIGMNETEVLTEDAASNSTTLEESRDISVSLRYRDGQILEYNLLLLLRRAVGYWMSVTARTVAYAMLPYGHVVDFEENGFRAALVTMNPGPNVMATKASDIVDGLLRMLIVLDRDRLWEPFSGTIYKPGRKPIAQIAVGGAAAVEDMVEDLPDRIETY